MRHNQQDSQLPHVESSWPVVEYCRFVRRLCIQRFGDSRGQVWRISNEVSGQRGVLQGPRKGISNQLNDEEYDFECKLLSWLLHAKDRMVGLHR